jgi:hypothetical protein
MENIKNEFTLVTAGENTWKLIPYEIKRFEHKFRELQPGQPVAEDLAFINPYREQELGFILTVKEEPVANITIEIDNNRQTLFPVTLHPGESLKYTGGNEAIVYSSSWHEVRKVRVDGRSLIIGPGEHKIVAGCDFKGEKKGILKLELKTAGEPETVEAAN